MKSEKISGTLCRGVLPLLLGLLVLSNQAARGEELTVQVPAKDKVTVATAIERGTAVNVAGKVDGHEARFDLQPDTSYDLAIEQSDGTLLCGADLSWCDETPADPQAEPLGDEDREQIRAIVQDIPQFGNKPKILTLRGDHDRAVGLVESSRTNAFHSDSGGEVIWRVEVWFFKWQAGGWERVSNQSRILRRERFKSADEYEKELKRLRWVPELGGVKLAKGAKPLTLHVSGETPLNPPATKGSDSPAGSGPADNRP